MATVATRPEALTSSFRDPAGYLFSLEGVVYRQINESYKAQYRQLMDSGLYQSLVDSGLLVSHEEVSGVDIPSDAEALYCVIKPEQLSFISYPYEWCFSQLKDAALATLEIQKKAIENGMVLKDASAYNIQFSHGRPVFIDTLSFDFYEEGTPWIAYKQFCQHFLGPLALMALKDVRLGQLLKIYIDGPPLDLVSTLLPKRSKINMGLLTHIHLHAGSQKKYEDTGMASTKKGEQKVSKMGLLGLIDNLESTIKGLEWKPEGTEWGDYYDATNYSDDAFTRKKELVQSYIKESAPKTLWDLGANTGEFSRLGSELSILTVAFDIDPAAVEKNYRLVRHENYQYILPLIQDLTNPSPAIGFGNEERDGFNQRGPVDCVMALALIHHLAISNNVPLERLALWFSGLCRHLIIEFVPKSDSQVVRLLSSREDIFPNYTQEGFEQAFLKYFDIKKQAPIEGSERVLYLLKTR